MGRFKAAWFSAWRTVSAALASPILVPVLVVDAVLVVVHLLYRLSDHGTIGGFDNPRLSLETDRGLGEWFGYLNWLVALVGLVLLARRHRAALLGVLAATIGLLMLDDALSWHERIGEALADTLIERGLLGLEANAVGELVALGAFGFLVVIAAVASWPHAAAGARLLAGWVAGFLLALAFFGGAVDALHAATIGILPVSGLAMLEDGGELVVITLLASFLLARVLDSSSDDLARLRFQPPVHEVLGSVPGLGRFRPRR